MSNMTRRAALCTVASFGWGLSIRPDTVFGQSDTNSINSIIKGLAPRRGQIESDGAGGGRRVPLGEIKRRQTRARVKPIQRDRVILRDRVIYIDLGRSLDFEIYFEYDSDRLTPRARRRVNSLGDALMSDDLAPFDYFVAGHTDAAGSHTYNDDLSFRRARSVCDHLISRYPIHPDRLVPHGFGERRLKVPSSPRSAVNRRVQVALIVE